MLDKTLTTTICNIARQQQHWVNTSDCQVSNKLILSIMACKQQNHCHILKNKTGDYVSYKQQIIYESILLVDIKPMCQYCILHTCVYDTFTLKH